MIQKMKRYLIYMFIVSVTNCLIGFTTHVYGQNSKRITGTVVNAESNEPLEGVNILVGGRSSTATSTDANGRYSLNVYDEDQILVFSYIGFATQQIRIGDHQMIDVSLSPSDAALEEVTVTALGLMRKDKSLGYSVGKVDGDDVTNVAQENVLGGLSGKVAGVQISQTGGVGSSVSMVIRGATSLSSDNQPLYVVDGVPITSGMDNIKEMGSWNQIDYGNPISDLDPDEIEDISILKGPSAAALYGSRAGNGVVLITTKSGKEGQKTQIDFSTSNVFEKPYRYLDLHYKFANGSRVGRFDESSDYWAGPELDVGNTAAQWNSPLDANGNKIPTELRSHRDNMKNFLNTGFTSTNNLSLSGSGSKTTYRVSLNHMNHSGLVPNSDLFRNSLSTAIDYSLNDAFKLSSKINVIRSHSNDMPATANRGSNPLQAVYHFSHVDIRELRDYWQEGQEGVQQVQVTPGKDNPYFLAYGINNGFIRDRIYGNLRLDWEIDDNWSMFLRGAETHSVEERETKIPWSYTRESQGAYHLQGINKRENNIDFLATYQNSEDLDFTYSASVGGNYLYMNNSDSYMGSKENAGIVIPGLYRISNISSIGLSVDNNRYRKAIYSLYAMANLGFRDQLFLDLTARNDWSSTLPKNNRSYFYPSASLSWLVNEAFEMPSDISLLKLRGGLAKVGNDADPYQLTPVLGHGSWGDLNYTEMPTTLLNPDLKPEIATSSEVGIDLNMFDNRLRLDGTYYMVENKNQILSLAMPASSGFTQKLINAGKLQSKGWEFSVGGTPIKDHNGFNWDVNVNFTRNRTKVVELADGIDYISFWEENGAGSFSWVGEEVGNLFSRGYAKVTEETSEYYNWPILSDKGEWIRYDDLDQRELVGNVNPNFTAGLQSTLTYKRFSLGFSLDWRNGGQFQSFTYRYGESDWKSQRQLDLMFPGGNYTPDELASILKSEPEKYIIPSNGNFPRVGGLTESAGGYELDKGGIKAHDGVFIPGVIAEYDAEGNITGYREHLGGPGTVLYEASDQFPWRFNEQVTFDSDFIKLREVTLGYDIPNIKHISNLKVSVYARNIMIWTKSKIGIDPERAFQPMGDGTLRQGAELQNVMPWTIPVGVKLNVSF